MLIQHLSLYDKDKKDDTTHVYFNNISSLQIMQAIILASKKKGVEPVNNRKF
jgi:hypothetical protein